MANTTTEWIAAVAKIRGYVKVYLGLKTLNARQQAALQTDLKTLDRNLAELADSLAAAPSAVAPAEGTVLSSDPTVAQVQILVAIGLPPTRNADGSGLSTADVPTIFAACSPEQNRQLALIGLGGWPGSVPGVDYSLFEQYMEIHDEGLDATGQPTKGWQPKPEFANTGTWQGYLASKQ